MEIQDAPSPPVASPQEAVEAFERRARRFETPCGDAVMTWRAWGSGPPLMLAHGAQGGWSHWIRNIDAFAASRTVWAPDLPGHGDSAMPATPDHPGISQALAAGLRQLVGAELPIDIVGFSMGGVIAAHLSALHPELVRRVILVGCGGLDTPMGHVEIHRVRGLEGEARRAALRANLLAIMIHDPAKADDLALYLQEFNGRRGKLQVQGLVLPDRLLEALPRMKAQVDAVWGEFDGPHPDPAVQAEAIRRCRPDADFRVVGGAGHWCLYEQAEAFNAVVLDLLAQPLRAAANR